jgi:general secretion pathway protein L
MTPYLSIAAMADKTLIIDLSTPSRLGDLPDLLGKFLLWWKDELLALTPWRGAQAGARQAQSVTMMIRRHLWLVKPSEPDQASLSLDTGASDGELADEILRSGAGMPLSRLKLLLPRDHALLRRLELPQMAEARLRQAVELQIDRLSPFKADAVRFAAKVAARDIVQGTMHVDVAIVPLARIEPIERRLKTLGFTPMSVDVEGEDGVACGFDLCEPPDAEALRRRRNVNLGLGAAAILMWLLAMMAWNQAGERDAASWQERIDAVRPQATRSAAIRRQLEAVSAPIAMANTHDPAQLLDTLNELTKILPDSTRIVEMRIEGRDVRLSGLSTDAPALIGLLENSPRFGKVNWASSLVSKPDSDIKRFEIVMNLEGRGAP